MSLPVVIIRPEPGCTRSVEAARLLGLEAHGFALFAVRAVDWTPPDPDTVDALLIGSANAVRHAGAGLARFRDCPAYVVGETTAQVARAAGLNVAATGQGGLQAVLDAISPAKARVLRLAGRERVTLTPPDGITIEEHVVYASEPRPMPAPLCELLRSPALVVLHSGEAARHFASLVDSHGIGRALIRIAAIGPRVAAQAGEGWGGIASAPSPDDRALLALARQMCQL